MKILLCISRLPYAQATLAWGNLLGSFGPSELTLLTVFQATSEQAEAAATLDEVRTQLTAPVVAAQLRRGRVIAEIVAEAENDYDLIVIGDYHSPRIWDFWRTPRPVRLARQAPTSLLIVKSGRPAIKRMLISTAAHEHSRPAVEMGVQLARIAGAAADVLYVRSQVPGMFSSLREMNESDDDLLAADTPVAEQLRWASSEIAQLPAGGELRIRAGLVVDTILAEAAAGDYDLLVLGAHGQGNGNFFEALLVDDVIPKLIELSTSSVLLVRPDN